MLGKILSYLVLVISVLMFFYAPTNPDRLFLGYCILMASILMYIHIKGIYVERELRKVYLRHSVVFLLIFFIVFFQRDLDYSLGLLTNDSIGVDLFFGNAPHVVSKACALSLIALSSFLCGYYRYSSKYKRNNTKKYVFKDTKVLVFGGFFLMFLHILQYGIGNFSKDENTDTAILIIMQAVLLAIIVANAYDIRSNSKPNSISIKKYRMSLVLIFLFLFIYFASANRGGAIKVCLMLLVAYIYITDNRVNYKKIAIIAIAGAFSITMIGLVRSMVDRDINAAMKMLLDMKSISPLTSELAGSVNTVHVALGNVPSMQDYNYGSSFFPRFNILIPGLNRIMPDIPTSEDIITTMFFGGKIPTWGWGLGSSAVADVYIAFGMLGVIIIFFIFGWFIHYLEYGTFCIQKSPLFLVLSFCVYSQLISLCRGPFAILFLSLDFALILVLIFMRKRIYTKK